MIADFFIVFRESFYLFKRDKNGHFERSSVSLRQNIIIDNKYLICSYQEKTYPAIHPNGFNVREIIDFALFCAVINNFN